MNAPLPQQATLSLDLDTKLADSGQYFCNERQFALPMPGNKVERLDSGAEAFAQILKAMKSAERFIWIADWQMAFDVELAQRGEKGHPGRLIEVIKSIVQTKPVQIRVLLYRSFADAMAPGTRDGMVSSQINAINNNSYPGKVIVLLQAPTSAQQDSIDYSHHQKFVVIDGNTGFIGGIDLSYGRYSTPEFDVVVDPSRYVLNEMYNPCATKLRGMAPHEEELVAQGFSKSYENLIDEGCQPRMPWQDVHIKLVGPAVVDMHRNFVRRWNARVGVGAYFTRGRSVGRSALPDFKRESVSKPGRIDIAWLEACGGAGLLRDSQNSKPGGATVQIVRSVSNRHLAQESLEGVPDDVQLFQDKTLGARVGRGILEWRTEHQANILNAMVNCIRSADCYVYIETQFFISRFGTACGGKVDSSKAGNENDGIKNTIVDVLAERIEAHIAAGTPFHVYLVLPVHPEGAITDGSVWKQHWLALATIHHGEKSLIGQIKRAIKKHTGQNEGWNRYLTVLNMRSYGVAVQYARDPKTWREDFSREIGRYVITEQVYIHSKLLIVDDAVAIVGSANINDRSLTGNGDTEIAAVVVDNDGIEVKDLGGAHTVPTRKFARELRRSLWEKHFGFALDDKKYFESTKRAERENLNLEPIQQNPPKLKTTPKKFRDTTDVDWQTVLDRPCHPASVKAIQTIAEGNARAFEAVFPQIPRNSMRGFEDVLACYNQPYPAAAAGDALDRLNVYEKQRATWEPPKESARSLGIGSATNRPILQRIEVQIERMSEEFRGVVPPL
ncbi:phospholipase D-like domain-containing protein [Variovorax sp. dw_954]|uniref:phospholipase D-like domain-containing protein n=1 Tax=Variovorax sp. dw_954 TaxID=2720078 RepID=UPI001BD6D030|nr:phospholipase D-like domain-containing protein [Variovorax sp. dw_954]